MKGDAQTIPFLRVQLTSGIASEVRLAAVSAVVRVAEKNDSGPFESLQARLCDSNRTVSRTAALSRMEWQRM